MMRTYWLATLILFSMHSVPLGAQTPLIPQTPPKTEIPQSVPPTLPRTTHPLTAADVETFLDGFVPLQLEKDDIAGATIAIVKDGQLLFARGYGYADYEKKKPVSAETTLFRNGSVSKLFTWTAVMQLAEQGKLDLDRDVNAYLDFKIPEAFGKPITLKNLLTHTPGFEERVKDLFVSVADKPSLREYLLGHTPARIYPPGTTCAYSNYGAALAGYIVERVSERPFSQYIDENILRPLGMNRSTFQQPPPSPLAANMSNGYGNASDPPKPFEIVGPEPAGSMSATATDMARFILAHLQGGQLGDARILRPDTVHRMHSKAFELHPAANGMAYGFFEESRNGHRIIGHAGDTAYFHSSLHLIPDANLGFFVSYNSAGTGKVEPRARLWNALLDRYFTDSSVPQTLSTASSDAKIVSGSYMSSRRGERSFIRTAAILGELTVTPSPGGAITVAQLTGPNGKPIRWREVAPLVFRELDGQNYLAFKRDGNGRMELMLSPYPVFVFQRVGLWNDRRVLLPVLVVSLALMVLTLVLWPVAALVRRHYRHPLELTPVERRLRLAVRIVLALNVVFLAAMIGIVAYGSLNVGAFNDRLDKWIYLAQLMGLIGAVGTLVVLYDAIQSWTSKRKRIWSKLYATVLALACLGFLWFVLAGNLLRFTASY